MKADTAPSALASDCAAHPVLLYDGVCGLCNRLVQFILRRDPSGVFRFAPLQSEVARRVLARHGADAADLDTVYVVVNAEQADEFLLLRSDAVVFILKHLKAAELRSAGQPGAAVPTQPIALGRTQPESSLAQAMLAGRGFWRFAGLVLQLVPRRVRDWGYGVVARNRYRVFGRYDTCLIPGEHTRSRFLDQD